VIFIVHCIVGSVYGSIDIQMLCFYVEDRIFIQTTSHPLQHPLDSELASPSGN
jgi:hypothetical protein